MILQEKTAVITGASRGIGAGIARRYAEEGAKLVLLARSERVYEIRDELTAIGAEVLACIVDVSKREEVDDAIRQAKERFGEIDILVNNAGVCKSRPFLETPIEELEEHLEVNLVGAWNVTQAVAEHMVKAGYGKIIMISSVTGYQVADAGCTAYAASKTALIGLTKSLAVELADNNIAVNAVCPGHVKTGMSQGNIEGIAAQIPMKRYGTPEEVGSLALFLGSSLSDYITGEAIVFDGGATLPETCIVKEKR